MSRRDTKLEHYARAIERRWAELLERPVVLSARDWDLVLGWHERGIPLQLIDECMQAAVQPTRGGRSKQLKGLSYLEPGVEEAWRVVIDGRVARPAEPATPAEDPAASWRERSAAEDPNSSIGRLLGRLLDRLDAGAAAREVDAELDRLLPDLAPGSLGGDLLRELDRELEGYRARMSPERLQSTRRRALVEKLRKRLGLARLTDHGAPLRFRPPRESREP